MIVGMMHMYVDFFSMCALCACCLACKNREPDFYANELTKNLYSIFSGKPKKLRNGEEMIKITSQQMKEKLIM